ncbi:dipeptidyl peptidase [Schizosaccharomyces cryophilus OY26]|uniref:Dipeptidyl peptidase n=1 Tax=Schizosaccharomyces cryophilus (strain OY26 / ATCC MYA-4695 / CBS 11777 / NBRC 106824 / NRRL Y48691) TaxID=653667 RepID=S9VVJ0_SCHCR|nr:dipeptidyl peptidase [Schizosaccharomyces cryophilus OY26]EPY50184.1 dipeptidyl peptidase [Schizosaccharomyces cryophilus OY26]
MNGHGVEPSIAGRNGSVTKQHWRKRSAIVSSQDVKSVLQSGDRENDVDLPSGTSEYRKKTRRKRQFIYFSLAGVLCLFVGCAILYSFYFLLHKYKLGGSIKPSEKYRLSLSRFDDGSLLPYHQEIEWVVSKEGVELYYDQSNYLPVFFLPQGSLYGPSMDLSVLQIHELCNSFTKKVASSDLEYVAYFCSTQKRWRYSVYNEIYILERKTGRVAPLKQDSQVIVAEWAPVGHHMAFVDGSNLYVWQGFEDPILSITDAEESESILNGIADWLYEEEILMSPTALWWSANGSCLSYLSFNDSLIPKYIISQNVIVPVEGGATENHNAFHYPRPGDPIPNVQLLSYCFSSDSVAPHPLHTQETSPLEEFYIQDVWWVQDESIMFVETSRGSTRRITHKYNVATFRLDTLNEELEEPTVPLSSSLGIRNIVWQSKNGYVRYMGDSQRKRLAFFNFDDNSFMYITPEDLYVLEFWLVGKFLFYTALHPNDPFANIFCLSTEFAAQAEVKISSSDGSKSIKISPDANYMLLNYFGPGIPMQKIYLLKACLNNWLSKISSGDFSQTEETLIPELLRVVEDNKELRALLGNYEFPSKHTETVNVHNVTASFQEIRPSNFNPNKKYATVFEIYGAPGSRSITGKYEMDANELMASSLEILVVKVDVREIANSSLLGNDFLTLPYYWIDIIRWYSHKQPYIDSSRLGLWGWSFGGYLVLKILEITDIISSALVVAPVVDWRFYDSYYAENLLGAYSANTKDRYEQSALHISENIKNVRNVLIVHGAKDDNVHLENTYQLTSSLIKNNLENFVQLIIPDANHDFSNIQVYPYLKKKIATFFGSCFHNL